MTAVMLDLERVVCRIERCELSSFSAGMLKEVAERANLPGACNHSSRDARLDSTETESRL